MSVRIPLTRGLEAIVDDADLPLVVGKKWCAFKGPYAGRHEGGRKNRTLVYMHRVILGVASGVHIDHVNGQGLDNRRSNLRIADQRENMRNQRMHADNQSGFKGVCPGGRLQRPWRAYIVVKGRQLSLGRFSEAREAARAYDEAAVKHFGSFARTNKMMGLL